MKKAYQVTEGWHGQKPNTLTAKKPLLSIHKYTPLVISSNDKNKTANIGKST